MTTSNIVKLAAFLCLAIGGWTQTLSHWADATTPSAVSGLLMILGSSLGLAFGVNTNGLASQLAKKITSDGTTPTPKE